MSLTLAAEKFGTFLHSKEGSGHLAQGGHGGASVLQSPQFKVGHAGQTGGTICDLNI